MANNKEIRDGNGQLFTTKTTESSGINTPHVNVDSIPLAQNASTEAKQDVGNTSLSSIDSKTPDLENGHVPIAIASAHYLFSTLNSSSAPLSSGQKFSGIIEDITIYPSVSVNITSNQNGILTMRQYIDALGNEVCNEQVYVLNGGIPLAFSFPINGNYFQAFFQNTGLSTANKFKLDIAYGAIEGATSRNNIPTAISEVAGNVVKQLFRTTFANTIVNGVDPAYFNPIVVGNGQTIGQSNGNLVVTSGKIANSETILRSTQSFYGSLLVRAQTILSQRIVNNNFFVELVDVIGDGLSVTINSATSITVTIPNNTFTSNNVGQSMYVGNFSGFTGATSISGRYAIASVSGDNVTFTTVGFVLGSVNTGTCSLFGWNYYKLLYTGTNATNALYDAQRRGWNSGDTTITINSTSGVGTMAILQNDEGNAYVLDQLVASSSTLQPSVRASRVVNLPEENTKLFLQIRALNGTTNPASNTTWTIGTVSIENFSALPTTINNVKAQGVGNTMPVYVSNIVSVNVSSAISAGANLIGDFGLQVRANATGTGTPVNINSPATPVGQIIKASAGRILSINLTNSNASARFLKVFNATSVTMGTTSALYEIAIPPSFNPLNISLPFASGASTGIVVAITGARGLTDNTAITANDVTGFITYA